VHLLMTSKNEPQENLRRRGHHVGSSSLAGLVKNNHSGNVE
jgi:hypothetical protein